MADDLKIDKLTTPLIVEPRVQQRKASVQAIQAEDGVIVSNQMGKLAQMINNNETLASSADRVATVKQQIESNQYAVNLDQLSEKLISHGILLAKGK